MADDETGGELSAGDMGMVGIVVQGARVEQAHPHLDFVWGPPSKAAPSLPFGRWKPGAKAA